MRSLLRRRARALCLSGFLGCFALAGVAQAQGVVAAPPVASSAQADALFREGKDRLAQEDYSHACPLFAESFRVDPATGTLLALAICHERAGDFASALQAYQEVVVRSKAEARADREQAAAEKVALLTPKVQLAAPPPDPSVSSAVMPAEVAAAAAPPPSAAAARATESGWTDMRWAGVATLGAALVSAGIGGVLVIIATGKNEDSDAGCDGDLCTASGRRLRLDARAAGDAASVSFLASSALAAVGVVLFASGARASADDVDQGVAPWVTPHAAGGSLRGAF